MIDIKANLLQNFSRYTLIGIVFYLLSVGASGLLIDIMQLPTLVTSFAILLVLFLIKYAVSVLLNVVKKQFRLYLISNAVISLLAPFGVWLAVDHWGLPASISTAVILASIFLLRYAVMSQVGLLNIKK